MKFNNIGSSINTQSRALPNRSGVTLPLLYLIALLLYLPTAGCRNEIMGLVPETQSPNDTIAHTLTLNIGNIPLPTVGTRAIEEGIDLNKNVWVLVFNNNGENATFHSIYQALNPQKIGTKEGENVYSYTFMAPMIDTPVRLLILANVPDKVLFTMPPYKTTGTYPIANTNSTFSDPTTVDFTVTNITAMLTGKTYKEAVNELLNAPMLDTKGTDLRVFDISQDIYTRTIEYIPMSGVKDLSKLNPTVNVGTVTDPVELIRCVARITVTNTAPNFRLLKISAMGMPINGTYCPPTAPAFRRDNDLNVGHYLVGGVIRDAVPMIGGKQVADHLYAYEYDFNPAKYDAQNKENRPLIAVFGEYTDGKDFNSAKTWYALAFPDDKILRNTHYNFQIGAVEAIGYGAVFPSHIQHQTPDAIKYNVEVTNLSSYDITRMGDSYVALSNSELLIYESLDENPRNTLVATHVALTATSPPTSYELTNYGNDVNLTITSPSILPVASPYATAPIEFDVVLAIDQPKITDTPSGSTSLTLGYSLFNKQILINRRGSLSKEATVVTDFATNEYVVGEITTDSPWIKLSSSAVINQRIDKLSVNSGGIYLHIEDNETAAPRTAELFFSRRTDKGRLKVILTQSAQHIEPKYHLFFNTNGGYFDVGALPTPYELSGTTVTLPYPISNNWIMIHNANHTFIGWSTNKNAQPDDEGILAPDIPYTITKEETLYAVWDSQNRIRVAFDLNGGIGNMPPGRLGFPFGDFPNITGIVTHPEGKTFKGWKFKPLLTISGTFGEFDIYINPPYSIDDVVQMMGIDISFTLHAIWE